MKRAAQFRPYRDAKAFQAIAGITSAEICTESGQLASPFCSDVHPEGHGTNRPVRVAQSQSYDVTRPWWASNPSPVSDAHNHSKDIAVMLSRIPTASFAPISASSVGRSPCSSPVLHHASCPACLCVRLQSLLGRPHGSSEARAILSDGHHAVRYMAAVSTIKLNLKDRQQRTLKDGGASPDGFAQMLPLPRSGRFPLWRPVQNSDRRIT